MYLFNSILLGAPSGAAGGGGGSSSVIMLIMILVVFYVFMVLPQIRKTKKQKQFREALSKGDRVITIGGINGKILEMGEQHLIIESEGTRLKIERTAVSMEASQALKNQGNTDKK